MIIAASIPYEVPSQNARDKWHWSKRKRDSTHAQMLINLEMIKLFGTGHRKLGAKGPRKILLTCFRKRLITDDANLRGGAKGLVDAIVRVGLLVDDNDRMAHIEYRQELASKHQTKKPCTVITLEDL